jgi:hypothetical protein
MSQLWQERPLVWWMSNLPMLFTNISSCTLLNTAFAITSSYFFWFFQECLLCWCCCSRALLFAIVTSTSFAYYVGNVCANIVIPITTSIVATNISLVEVGLRAQNAI